MFIQSNGFLFVIFCEVGYLMIRYLISIFKKSKDKDYLKNRLLKKIIKLNDKLKCLVDNYEKNFNESEVVEDEKSDLPN